MLHVTPFLSVEQKYASPLMLLQPPPLSLEGEEEEEAAKGPGPTKSKICTTTAPSNASDWMWYGVEVLTRWEISSSASGEVDGPVSTRSLGI